jgi:FkbM family methyltransferase
VVAIFWLYLDNLNERVFDFQKNGFFIEAGSNDGEYVSSTLGFERFDSWTGLCIEPSPVMQPIWRSKQRKAWFSDVCLSPKPYPIWTSFLHNDDYSLGSKLGNLNDYDKSIDGNWTLFRVPCFPLNSILDAMNVKEVDFFNLDVEGVELDILKTIQFNDILIKVKILGLNKLFTKKIYFTVDFC